MYNGLVFFVIPVIVGITAGLFLASYYSDNNIAQTSQTYTHIKLVDSSSTTLLYASSLIKGGSPFLGESDAPVTIVEWGDYQCTFCFLFHNDTLDYIKSHYIDTNKVRLVFQDFPLNGPDSVLAASASHCAKDQLKYWEYHNILYENWGGENTGWITDDAIYDFADQINLNKSEFAQCVDEQRYVLYVEDAYESGQNIGIDATPSFMIFNDTHVIKIRGNQPLDVFVNAIDRLLI